MDLEISKMGERGQIVIPLEFREELKIKKGEKLILVKSEDKIILQQVSRLKANSIDQLKEDLLDIKLAEDRLDEIQKGKCVIKSKQNFLKDLENWIIE